MVNQNFNFFLALVSERNITKAAQTLYVSQPLLSRYLKELESELGCRLFERNKHPLKLTDAGEMYLQYILKLRSMENELYNSLQEIGAATRGSVKLGISSWRASYLIPEIIPGFHSKYPNISIELFEGSQDELARMMEDEIIDFCVLHSPNSYNKLKNEFIAHEEIYIAVNSSNKVIQSFSNTSINKYNYYLPVSIDLLDCMDYIMLNDNQNLTKYIYLYFGKHGIKPRIIFRTSYIDTARGLVENGFGATFVPSLGVYFDQRFRNVTYLSINDDPIQWDICFSWKSGAKLSLQSQLLMHHIREILQRKVNILNR